MSKESQNDYCTPKTCFFTCGESQLTEYSNYSNQYGITAAKYKQKIAQHATKAIPFIQLGPAPLIKTRDLIKGKTEGKISIRETIKSKEKSKEKKLSLKKSDAQSSKSNLPSQEYKKLTNPIQKERLYSEYYALNQSPQVHPINVPQHSVSSAAQTTASRKTAFNHQGEPQNQINYIKINDFSNPRCTQIDRSIHIHSRQQERHFFTPIKNEDLKLGENLPTLRSEVQYTHGQPTERFELSRF